MKEGYYWFRESPGTQLHVLFVWKDFAGSAKQVVRDISGFLPRIRGPRYVSSLKGTWWKIEEPDSPKAECQCRQCLRYRDERHPDLPMLPAEAGQMIVCEWCGNKRCPHATDHRLECSGSNEPGQKGSVYQ